MKEPVIDPEIREYFRSVEDVPARDPSRKEEGKRAFLAEARLVKAAVSKPVDSRLNRQATIGKERIAMWKLAGAMVLAVGVLFGSGGAVVVGAQEAMPEDVLYPVKTWSEDARLWAESAPLSKMDLALQFADRRAEEILHQFEADLPVPDYVLGRMMDEDDLALSIAAQAGDADAPAALEKVRDRMENHERVLDYVGQGMGPDEDAMLLQTRQNIRQRLELLNGDLHDPQVRTKILEQVRDRANRPEDAPAGETNQNGEGGTGAGTGSESGQGAGPQDTPASGGGNGQGLDATCVCPSTCAEVGNGKGSGGGAAAGQGMQDGCVCPTLICTQQKGKQSGSGNP
jgi:hypothetical protein